MAASAAALGIIAPSAVANPVNCAVNASGGYINCLTFSNPDAEAVQAFHDTGLPYRFQLQRPATASTWGWWQYNDRLVHVVGLSLTGSITAQVDNLGTGNPSVFKVQMD